MLGIASLFCSLAPLVQDHVSPTPASTCTLLSVSARIVVASRASPSTWPDRKISPWTVRKRSVRSHTQPTVLTRAGRRRSPLATSAVAASIHSATTSWPTRSCLGIRFMRPRPPGPCHTTRNRPFPRRSSVRNRSTTCHGAPRYRYRLRPLPLGQ